MIQIWDLISINNGKNNMLEVLKTEKYKTLLKKHFNLNIIDIKNISKKEADFFNKYIQKKINSKSRNYDFEIHDTALTLEKTEFVYQIEKFLIGVCKTPNNKEFIVGYRVDEYYTMSFGTTISNWVTNCFPSESNEDIKAFMIDCHQLFNTGMELYNPGADESDWGFEYD